MTHFASYVGKLKDDEREASAKDVDGKSGKAILMLAVQALTDEQASIGYCQ